VGPSPKYFKVKSIKINQILKVNYVLFQYKYIYAVVCVYIYTVSMRILNVRVCN